MEPSKKDNVEKSTQLQAVDQQKQEIDLYYNNNLSLATVATLVAGFSFTAIGMDEKVESIAYLLFATYDKHC